MHLDDKPMPYCSSKFQIIINGSLLYLDFFFHVYAVFEIAYNPYFDNEYWIWYAVLLVIYFAALICITLFFCKADSKESRPLAAYAFLLAGIASFLIATWIIVYITQIYEPAVIKYPAKQVESKHDYDDPNDVDHDTRSRNEAHKEKRSYYTDTKFNYLMWKCVFVYLAAVFWFIMWWWTKMWVEENSDRDEALD